MTTTASRLRQGLVLAHGLSSGVITPRDITAKQQADAEWATQTALAHASVLAAAVLMLECEAAGDPPLADVYAGVA